MCRKGGIMFKKFKTAALAASIVAFANGIAVAGNVPESSDPFCNDL